MIVLDKPKPAYEITGKFPPRATFTFCTYKVVIGLTANQKAQLVAALIAQWGLVSNVKCIGDGIRVYRAPCQDWKKVHDLVVKLLIEICGLSADNDTLKLTGPQPARSNHNKL